MEHRFHIKEKSLISTVIIPYRIIDQKGFDVVLEEQLEINRANLRKAYFNEITKTLRTNRNKGG